MTTVRAKFRVYSITKTKQGDDEMSTIELSPVYSDDPESENRKFWRWTPSGSIKLGCVNPAAVEAFEIGAEYYVDFSKA